MGSLTQYVRSLMDQGFDEHYIKGYLAQYGYNSKDIEQALSEAHFANKATIPKTVKHQHSFSASAFIFVIFLAIVAGTLVFAVIKLLGFDAAPSQALLDLIAEPGLKQLQPGSDLDFTLRIMNLGNKERFDVFLSYTIEDEYENFIDSYEETIAVSTSLERDKTMTAPETPGLYILKVRGDYESKYATSSFTFRVKGEETVVTQPVSDEIDIVELAQTQPSQAGAHCLQFQGDERDDCLNWVVKESQRPEFCDDMVGVETRDYCYMGFIVQGEHYLCPRLALPENQAYCNRISDISILSQYSQVYE